MVYVTRRTTSIFVAFFSKQSIVRNIKLTNWETWIKFTLISWFADSNLFLTELMLRCPSKTFFRRSVSNLVKIGNILLSERDKFLFAFGLDFKLAPLLFKCSLLRLQLCIGFIFSLCMNPFFLTICFVQDCVYFHDIVI